jgi:tetratricopeptide (TPR) repeat protein
MAECHLLLGTYDKALQLADKALTVSPQNFDFMQTKGAALLALGKHTDAFQVFTDSVTLHDDLSQALLLTGLRYLNAGEPEAASKFFLRVLAEENPAPQAYAYLTYTYFQMSDTVKFLASLRKSVEVCPEILRDIMGHNFPGIEPQNYYDHIVSILSRTQSAASEEESGE